ncbi:hypothetical protein [Streptomyces abyssomicinicus]|uniref:hypothetical protein n=1 Tax=Streptomyces abyssomicinicus TaxID=574929 RepID=UPI00124FD972|nr:hypothetical protein [Streptomyces abyssomicinicus]
MTLPLIVALALGGVGVFIAYRNPQLGTALLVGLGVITVLYLVWEKDPSVFQPGVVPAPSATWSPAPESHGNTHSPDIRDTPLPHSPAGVAP